MADSRRVELDGAGNTLTCIDDIPTVARLAARQQFLNKWYRPLGLVPFSVLIFIDFIFLHGSNNGLLVALVFISLLCAGAVSGYAFYLLFAVKCPVCKNRFGLGENCSSCNLPRHRTSSNLFGSNS
jgi:hypothetical protein